MLRERAGIIDISNFAKYRVAGPGAEAWLNAVFANRMPREVGRSCLTPLIGVRGGIAGDATVTRLAEDEFRVISSGMAERYHKRFFDAVPLPEGTTFRKPHRYRVCGFNVAGPQAREMLQPLTEASLATADFPFMASRRIAVAGSMPRAAGQFHRRSGWELHCAAEDQARLYAALLDAGQAFRAGPVGSRALTSLRIEKGYGSWGREYGPEYWPQEAGLDRLCRMDKAFLNRGALEAVIGREPRERLVLMALDEADVTASNADATGGEPIFQGGEGVGRVTSGAYGYWVGQSLALGYVAAGVAARRGRRGDGAGAAAPGAHPARAALRSRWGAAAGVTRGPRGHSQVTSPRKM